MSVIVKSAKKTAAAISEFESKLADTVLAEVMSRLNIGECSAGSQISMEMLQQVAEEVSKAKTHEFVEKEKQVKVKSSRQKAREAIPEEIRCMARVWGTGSGKDQCSMKRIDDSDYCTGHHRQAQESETPNLYREDGSIYGLHLGRIDQEIQLWDTENRITNRWKDPELVSKINEALESKKCTFHPFEGKTKKAGKSKKNASDSEPKKAPKEKKAKKEKVEREESSEVEGEKPKKSSKSNSKKEKAEKSSEEKRPLNGYFRFRGENLEKAKAALSAEDAKKVTEVTKEIKRMWDALSEEDRAAYNDAYKADLADWNKRHGKEPKEKKEKKSSKKATKEEAAEESQEEPSETADTSPHNDVVAPKDELEDELAALEEAFAEEPVAEEEETQEVATEEQEEEADLDLAFEHDGIQYFKDTDGILYPLNSETEQLEQDADGNFVTFGYITGDEVRTSQHKLFGTLKDGVFEKYVEKSMSRVKLTKLAGKK